MRGEGREGERGGREGRKGNEGRTGGRERERREVVQGNTAINQYIVAMGPVIW